MYSLMSMLSTHVVKMAPEAVGVVDERRHGFNGPIFAIIVRKSFLPEKKLSKKYLKYQGPILLNFLTVGLYGFS